MIFNKEFTYDHTFLEFFAINGTTINSILPITKC